MAGASTKWLGGLSRTRSASAWAPRVLALVALATVVALAAGACSGAGDDLNGAKPGTSGPTYDGGTGTDEPCVDGEEKACHVTIGEHDGVLTCMDGVQRCEGGVFGPCGGTISMRRSPFGSGPEAPDGPGTKPLSFSDAAPCTGNPCDPECQSFGEDPPDIAIPGSPISFPWTVGDINALPDATRRLGSHQPCTTGEDCQFDQYCDNPGQGACEHHPCATGTSLLSTCSPCVQKICNNRSSCCTQTAIPSDCTHDACTSGAALDPACGDPCVADICAAYPSCCTGTSYVCNNNAFCTSFVGPASTCILPLKHRCQCGVVGGINRGTCPAGYQCNANLCEPTWSGANCVSRVPTVCGRSCTPPATSWDATCASMVGSLCGTSCETDPGPTCAHDKCYTGDPLNAAACTGTCVSQVCSVRPSCCTTSWTQACVDLVESVCGETCPQSGVCTSYLPNETNAACAGVDLTLGLPCDTGMGVTVPVCNRGTVDVPAGTPTSVYSFAANSGQIPSSRPSRVLNSCSTTGGTLACTTTQAIPAGQCVSVLGCTGVAAGMELVVNPVGRPGHITECHCENNGSIYETAACQSPACIATASVSLVQPVSLFVALDSSRSMWETLAPTVPGDKAADRWIPATNALKAFFANPESAGLGVAFRFWPDNNPASCDDAACPGPGGGGCAIPLIPLGLLTADPAPADTQENALINAINAKVPYNDTPMYPAMDGATSWAIARKLAHPEEEVEVIFVTDGIPKQCGTIPNNIANLARNAFLNYNVRVHAIGFGQSTEALMQLIADRGGGRAFFLTEGVGLENELLSALNAIRGDVLPCDVNVPVAGLSDPSQVSVVFVDNAGTSSTLTKQTSAAGCGQGWYFDPMNPANVKLCPQTCGNIRAASGGRVQAVVPCTTATAPMDTPWERYQATCEPGQKPQWGYLTYDTVDPSDSSVEFFVRSADTVAGLASATVRSAATARSTPTDTQICDTTQAPPCTVDLFDALGELPDARNNFLELRMTLTPPSVGTGTPTVRNWEITFSCIDAE